MAKAKPRPVVMRKTVSPRAKADDRVEKSWVSIQPAWVVLLHSLVAWWFVFSAISLGTIFEKKDMATTAVVVGVVGTLSFAAAVASVALVLTIRGIVKADIGDSDETRLQQAVAAAFRTGDLPTEHTFDEVIAKFSAQWRRQMHRVRAAVPAILGVAFLVAAVSVIEERLVMSVCVATWLVVGFLAVNVTRRLGQRLDLLDFALAERGVRPPSPSSAAELGREAGYRFGQR